MSRAQGFFFALLRIAAGVSLLLSGVHKLSWFTSSAALTQQLQAWAAKPPNGFVLQYLQWLTPKAGLFAKLVVLGELGLGAMLVVGLFTPLAALLAFLMVANFQLTSGQAFHLEGYVAGESPLAYLLIYPALVAAGAGRVLGLDGMLAGGGRSGGGGGAGGPPR